MCAALRFHGLEDEFFGNVSVICAAVYKINDFDIEKRRDDVTKTNL